VGKVNACVGLGSAFHSSLVNPSRRGGALTAQDYRRSRSEGNSLQVERQPSSAQLRGSCSTES
jgi:hypothetical protein